jgi:hypothetical protein
MKWRFSNTVDPKDLDKCIRTHPVWLEHQTPAWVLADFWSDDPFHFLVYAGEHDQERLAIGVLTATGQNEWTVLAIRVADRDLTQVDTLYQDDALSDRIVQSLSMSSVDRS